MRSTLYRTAVFATTAIAAYAGHELGDYLVQRDSDAQIKQHHTPEGRKALAIHGVSYAVTQAAVKVLAYRACGVRVPVVAQLAGATTEAIIHVVIDDGRLLRWFAYSTGHRRFHDLADHGVNGRMLMDQAGHKGLQIPVGAAVTTLAAWCLQSRR